MLPTFFPSWSGWGLISMPVQNILQWPNLSVYKTASLEKYLNTVWNLSSLTPHCINGLEKLFIFSCMDIKFPSPTTSTTWSMLSTHHGCKLLDPLIPYEVTFEHFSTGSVTSILMTSQFNCNSNKSPNHQIIWINTIHGTKIMEGTWWHHRI